ncbi:MAG: lysophospholipid acyltransferase family protein [Bacteroidales bacterium]|nr:lysophospholipid acyltransferase family protein [Bacteroidales bacterium]
MTSKHNFNYKKFLKIRGYGSLGTSKLIFQLLQNKKIREFHESNTNKNPLEYLDLLIERLNVKLKIDDSDLKNIPAKGPFIIIANHPFVGLDGLLLLHTISKIRPDFKLLSTKIANDIPPLNEFFFPIIRSKGEDTFFSGIKSAFQYIRDGSALGIFPAGDVLEHASENFKSSENQWQENIVTLIKKMEVPIIPVYFYGKNVDLFYLLDNFPPLLRNWRKTPSEFTKLNKNVRMRIGVPLSIKAQKQFSDIGQFTKYLRARTLALGSTIEVGRFFQHSQEFKIAVPEEIIPPVDTALLEQEIEKLKEKNYYLFSGEPYDVYCAPSNEMPNLLYEIGRLRELSFRAVGEGTNKSYDLDEYDLYYCHLFIWDTENRKIVGAYRVGKGNDIMQNYGVKGFYLHSLFNFSKKFHSYLNESLELGRSFISQEYQQKPLSLFLLWKGILYFLLSETDYRYLIGPVSISNNFSKFSRGLIVEFIKQYFYDHDLAQHIKSRKKLKVNTKGVESKVIFDAIGDNLNKLNKFIDDIEPQRQRFPVLLKKYLKLNGKIIGFNLDPLFNDALDGLLLLDLYDVPLDIVKSLSKEIDDTQILERFNTLTINPNKSFSSR